jgi:SAM-dependent methyltransferase
MGAVVAGVANAVQAGRWNGAAGHRWVAQRERHVALREPAVPHLLRAAAVSRGDRVLDVGCGCGELTLRLAAASGVDGAVLGLDISGVMLAVARELAATAGPPSPRFVEADAQVHPFAGPAFDVVVSSYGVMFFEDPEAAFANLRGALRPGGRLALLCWQDDARNEVFGVPLRAFAAHDVPVGPSEFDPFTRPEHVADLLIGAGFTRVRATAVRGPAPIGSDVDDVLEYVRATSRVRELLAGLDEALAERVLATMAEEYRMRERSDGVWVHTASWLVTAVSNG